MMMLRIAALLLSLGICASAHAATTWDSGNCDAGVTLSAGDTIATRTAGGWKACRGTTSHNFDYGYIIQFDYASDNGGTDRGSIVGIGDSSTTLTGYLGSDAGGWGWQAETPPFSFGWYHNGSDVVPNAQYVKAGSAYIKIDSSGNVQLSNDCSFWVSPNSLTPISTSNPIYPFVSIDASTAGTTSISVTIRPNAPGCGVMPGGFVAWDGTPGGFGLFPGSMMLMGVGH